MHHAGKEPFPQIYEDGKEDGIKYQPIAKAQLKKVQKIWARECYKEANAAKKEKEDQEKRTKNLEQAKQIVIEEDKTLSEAKRIKINEGSSRHNNPIIVINPLFILIAAKEYRGQRVKIFGWAHRIRRQGKNLMFITLRDGTGFLQSVLTDKLCQTYNAVVLSTESSVVLFGTLKLVPEGKIVRAVLFFVNLKLKFYFKAPGGHELHVDYWELIGLAPPGGADSILNEEALPDVLAENRHIVIRGEHTSKVLRMRSVLLEAFRYMLI